MFSYFESSVDGIIPNEYSTVDSIFSEIFGCIASMRDSCMLTARRFWLAKQQLVTPEFSKKIFLFSFSKDSTQPSNQSAHDFDASLLNNDAANDNGINETSTKLTKSTDPTKQQSPSNNQINNSPNILLNNLNNLNKRCKDNENALIITNNEIRADLNATDDYYDEFSNTNNTKSQQFTKKKN